MLDIGCPSYTLFKDFKQKTIYIKKKIGNFSPSTYLNTLPPHSYNGAKNDEKGHNLLKNFKIHFFLNSKKFCKPMSLFTKKLPIIRVRFFFPSPSFIKFSSSSLFSCPNQAKRSFASYFLSIVLI